MLGRSGRKAGPQERLEALRRRVEDAVAYHQPSYDDFDRWLGYYDGSEQYNELEAALRARKLDDLVGDITIVNYLYSTVEHYLATAMRSLPRPFVVGNDTSQDQAARLITDYLHAYARATNTDGEIERAYRSALVFGTGVLKAYWCRRRKRVVVRSVPPKLLVPDPCAARLEDCAFIAIRNEYGEDLLRALWPTAHPEELERSRPDARLGTEEGGGARPERYLVWEVYEDFGAKLTIFSGNQVLYEGDNPAPGGRYPLAVLRFMPREDKFFSAGLVELCYRLQTNINKLLTRIAIHLHYTANPIIVTSSKAEFRMEPGSIVRPETPDMKVEYLRPERVPVAAFNVLGLLGQGIDTVSGVHDVLRGANPPGVRAAVSLDILTQSAATRLQSQIRNWSTELAALWQLVLELTQAYEPGDVHMPTMVEGTAGLVTVPAEMLSTVVERRRPDGSVIYREDGSVETDVEPLPYQVVMQADAELPLNAATYAQTAIQLAQLGAIDAPTLLEALKFPGREQLLERMAAEKQAELAGQLLGMQGAAAGRVPQPAPQQAPPPPEEAEYEEAGAAGLAGGTW